VFTRFRAKLGTVAGEGKTASRSFFRSLRSASSPTEWVSAAIHFLLEETSVDRIGVWVEEPGEGECPGSGCCVFRGEVWEQGIGEGPAEWRRLARDAPLPVDLLNGNASLEVVLDDPGSGPIMGPVAGLSRVVWAPVARRGMLRGLVMLGSRMKSGAIPSVLAEDVAAAFTTLIELHDERRQAALYKADLELWARFRSMVSEGQGANRILGQLMENCTRGEANGGVGAVFALTGELESGNGKGPAERLSIRAESGDSEWAHRVNTEVLRPFWKSALEKGQAIGEETGPLIFAKEISRIIGIPLPVEGKFVAVCLVGLPKFRANLSALERLELRAHLATEIFQREARERQSRIQHAWHAALMDSADDGIVLLNRHSRVAGVSRGARTSLGNLPPEAGPTGDLRFAELFRPRDWEKVEDWATGRSGKRDDGSEGQLEAELSSATPVLLKRLEIQGEEFQLVRIERKGQGVTLGKAQQVEGFVRQVVEGLEDGVAVFHRDETVLAGNTRFRELLGIGPEQPEFRTLGELIDATASHAKDPDGFAADWREVSRDPGKRRQQRLEMEKPAARVVERWSRALRDERGIPVGRVEIYREAPDPQAIGSRMLQAERLASLGQRVTGIMHELSNPLTTILGHAQRILARENGNLPRSEVRQILEQAERASGILRQFLRLSRETKVQHELLTVDELVKHTVELHRASLNGFALHFRLEVGERLPRIDGDYGQLQQVLINLLQNAQQSIELSGVGDTVGVRASVTAGGRVRVEVWDNGPGVPIELRERIFEPFFTTKPPGIGTGLGLAIVSAIVRQHGGSVSLDCPALGGARFAIELPVAQESAEARDNRVVRFRPAGLMPTVDSRAGESTRGRVAHILVVEDEPTVANLIADVLRDEGMRVDVLTEGAAALEAVQRNRYDLTICDLQMPGMDGRSLYARLAQKQFPVRGRFLFVTGDVLASRTQEFLEKYQLPHVAKPFRVDELMAAVRGMLNGERHAATP